MTYRHSIDSQATLMSKGDTCSGLQRVKLSYAQYQHLNLAMSLKLLLDDMRWTRSLVHLSASGGSSAVSSCSNRCVAVACF